MEVTLSGRAMEVRALQPKKAEPPMEITLSGRGMEGRNVQPRKAPFPMEVRFVQRDRSTEVRDSHP